MDGLWCATAPNTIDRAVCQRLLDEGCVDAPLADTNELCRRMYLDLTGTSPSAADIAATCAGKSAREIATTLMDTEAYKRHSEELWAERLVYDATMVSGRWLVDADRIVDELVTGRIGYDTFAKRISAHPVLAIGSRLPRSCLTKDEEVFFPQVARRATTLFLGRDPIGDEEAQLAQLFRPWKKEMVMKNSDFGQAEVVLDPAACPCVANVFGTPITIDLNLLTASIRYETLSDDRARKELEKVGALFVAQETFWTQAADIALSMYIGWWKSTSALDRSLLPEVQIALANQLRRSPDRSFKDLVLEVMTSTLYLRSNRAPAEARTDLPPVCSGPFRMVRPEAYVRSLGAELAVNVGRCDHRTNEKRGTRFTDGSEGTFYPHALRGDVDSDEVLLGTKDFHWEAARAMGGCNAGGTRIEDPTLRNVFGAAPVAEKVCSVSPVIVPAGVAPDDRSRAAMERIAKHLSSLLLSRELSPGELETIENEAERACAAGPTCNARSLATGMCAAMARSLDFMTY